MNFCNQSRRMLLAVVTVMVLISLFSVTVFAETTSTEVVGDVAGAVEATWNAAKGQIKNVVNNVVFPVVDLVLAVCFFVRVAMTYMDYRKHNQIEWAPAAILFATLVFSLTAPLYIWDIIGM